MGHHIVVSRHVEKGRGKEERAVATRYDKLAVNFLATLPAAMIQRSLRRLVSWVPRSEGEPRGIAVVAATG